MSDRTPLMGGSSSGGGGRRGGTVDDLMSRMSSIADDYKSIIIPASGNISASYNICNIGYVVQLIRLQHPVPRWAAPAFSASCLIGAMVGQVALGWLGDRIGRRQALTVTLVLIVVGALGSAIFTTGCTSHPNPHTLRKNSPPSPKPRLTAPSGPRVPQFLIDN
jgi:MFS family permease